jgi:hypothetical protein
MNRRTLSVDKETEAVEQRPARIPVGTRPKMSVVGKDPDYEYRWVNDIPGRIDDFKEGGWIPCIQGEVNASNHRAEEATSVGSLQNMVANPTNGQRAYLMRIHKDLYREDFLAGQKIVDELERDQIAVNANDGEYGSIKIDRSGRR